MHEVTGVTIPEMRTMSKAMLNSGKAIVRLIKSITLKLWIKLLLCWVKGWTPLKGTWLWLPYDLCMGVKHTGEPRFVCSSKILEPKFSLPNIDAFLQILDSLTTEPKHLLIFDQKLSNWKKVLVQCWEEMWQHLNILNINLLPAFKVLLTQH